MTPANTIPSLSNQLKDMEVNKPHPVKNEQEQDDWVLFQNEVDSVRDVVLMFKTKECTLNCSNTDCFFYHNLNERRRKPFNNLGKLIHRPDICLEMQNCSNMNCSKSHNFYEINYHPWRFKTKPCEVDSKSSMNNSNTQTNSSANTTGQNTGSSIISNTPIHNEKLCPYFHNPSDKREPKDSTNKGNKRFSLDSNVSEHTNQVKFDLFTFKVFKCLNNSKHSEKQCVYFHSNKDRRRSQNQFYYIAESCPVSQADQKCTNGDYCIQSHNQVELFYHKEKFKTKFCSYYHSSKDVSEVNNDCPYGTFCSFAHYEREIRIELIHKLDKTLDFFIYNFKTVVCPFDHKHDKSVCEYSHNLQDFRRNPRKYVYEKKNCSKWDNKKTVLNYSEGCPDGYGCLYCHGWKELDFHPMSYKTTKCKHYKGNCEKGALCPFYHYYESKRIVDEQLKKDYELKIKAKHQQGFKFNYSKNLPSQNLQLSIGAEPYVPGQLNKSQLINTGKTNSHLLNNSQIGASAQQKKHNSLFKNNQLEPYDTHSNKSFNIAIEKNYIFNTKNTYNSPYFSGHVFTTNSSYITGGSDIENNLSKRSISPLSSEIDNSFNNQLVQHPSNLLNTNSSLDLGVRNDDEDGSQAEKKKENMLENIEKKNKEIKALFDIQVLDQSMEGNNDLKSYLEENGFEILLEKLEIGKISQKELINISDEKILDMIEDENKEKFLELREFLMKLDECNDADDLLNSIDRTIGNESENI